MINDVTKHTGINYPFRGHRHIFFCFITLNLCAGAGKKTAQCCFFKKSLLDNGCLLFSYRIVWSSKQEIDDSLDLYPEILLR